MASTAKPFPSAVHPSRPHGALRGLDSTLHSHSNEGFFGRMFRTLPAARFSEKALVDLGAKMTAAFEPPPTPETEADPEENTGISAGYTYFGQFIDHDLTFDPASSLQKQNDPDALEDYRTPRFDLDNVYGRGPDDQPYLYENGRSFLRSRPLTGAAANPAATDLPRSQTADPQARRAISGDTRHDENVIVSQFQGLLHRFHNKLPAARPDLSFTDVQREVRFHYQWVVLNDFLPTIVSEGVLEQVLPHLHKRTNVLADRPQLQFFHWTHTPYMPLEFSAAAYRFGHSMVRPGYRLSETVGPLSIFGPDPNKALTGFREFAASWAIDWNLFMDLQARDPDDTTR